jgi:glycosyltransferase involved in cell wall biosynthesis
MGMGDDEKTIRVLMLGPGLCVTGGVSAVVNNWLEAGLSNMVRLEYIATLTESRAGLYPGTLADGLKAVLRFIGEIVQSYDLVHIHLSYGASFYRKLLFFLIARMSRKRTIIHLHGSRFQEFYDEAPAVVKRLISYMFNNADAVLVLSRQWQNFVGRISVNPEVHILFNGSFPRELPARQSNEVPVITFMGRLGSRKGIYDLIEAFDRLRAKGCRAELLLCGDGDTDKVSEIVRARGLESCVKVLGWVEGDQKEAIYLRSDIFILPSYNEGLPGAIVEAMSYGLPVIASDVGGIPEAVNDGVNGILVRAGDVTAITQAMGALLRDPARRRKMGLASAELIISKFNVYRIVEQLLGYYRNIVSCRA